MEIEDRIYELNDTWLKTIQRDHSDWETIPPQGIWNIDKLGLGKNSYRKSIRRIAKDIGISFDDKEFAKFSLSDASLIIVAHILRDDQTFKPRLKYAAIVAAVKRFRREQNNQSLWPQKIRIAIYRTERIIVARVLGFVASYLGSVEQLPQDCLIIARGSRQFTGTTPVIITNPTIEEVDSEIRNESKRQTDVQDFFYAVATERGQFYLLDRPIEVKKLSAIKFMKVEFRLQNDSSMTLTIGTSYDGAGNDPSLLANIKANLERVEELEERPFYQLLKNVVVYWPQVKREITRTVENPPNIIAAPHTTAEFPNLPLWVFSKLIEKAVTEETQLRCFCEVLVPRDDEHLRIWANSRSDPWNLGQRAKELPKGQFLSGAVMLTNGGLLVENKDSSKWQLISYNRQEQVDGAIAFPTLDSQTAEPNGAVYVGLFFKDAGANQRVKTIRKALCYYQILGLCSGELIQREILAENAVKTGARMSERRVLAEADFEKELRRVLKDIQYKDDMKSSLRLPIVLYSAAPDPPTSNTSRALARWLGSQLEFLNLESDLSNFVLNIRGIERSDLVVGLIGEPPVLVILLPQGIERKDLRRLRELTIQRNRCSSLYVEGGAVQLRIGAWVLDYSYGYINNGFTSKRDLGSEIMSYLKRWPEIAPYVIRTYKNSRVNGKWEEALREAKAGLSGDKTNSYLYRRAAASALVIGKLVEARAFAKKASELAPEHVGTRCLSGDVHLAWGDSLKALSEYSEAAKKDNSDPFPYYCAGFALMAIARVIRDWLIDSLRKAKPNTPITTKSIEYIVKTDALISRAKVLFEQSADKFPQYEDEALMSYKEETYGAVNSLAQAELSLLIGDPDAIVDFRISKTKYPGDESSYRGLLRAFLTRYGAQKLATQIDFIVEATKSFGGKI